MDVNFLIIGRSTGEGFCDQGSISLPNLRTLCGPTPPTGEEAEVAVDTVLLNILSEYHPELMKFLLRIESGEVITDSLEEYTYAIGIAPHSKLLTEAKIQYADNALGL